METDGHTDDEIRRILGYRRVAVVGMSRDPAKAAHYVPKYLAENGYDITPVNPQAESILGRRCHRGLGSITGGMDVVDVFRPSEDVPPVIDDAIKAGPRVVWLQEGIHNTGAEEAARAAGIEVVFDRCMMAEHRRLF